MPKKGWESPLKAKYEVNRYIVKYYNNYRPDTHNKCLSKMEKESALKTIKM